MILSFCSEKPYEGSNNTGTDKQIFHLLVGQILLCIDSHLELPHQRDLVRRWLEHGSFPLAHGHGVGTKQLAEFNLGQPQ
ncbi:MAG: hypothetical protein D4S02_13380 [Rhodocyclaceae bacterium]|nr:MAG: hypothetical protein D4S02_13380 [Rhodocyclaceae bacterium]